MNFVKKYWPHFLLIFFILILIFITYKDYGTTWDEKEYIDIGKYFLTGIYNYFGISHSLTYEGFIPTAEHLKTHGILFDVLVVFLNSLFKNRDFDFIHLIRALLAMPIFILVGLIVRRFLGHKASFFSLILLILFPVFYGSIFINPIDIPAVFFFTISLAYFIYYWESNQNLARQLIFAFIIALTINQRSIFWYVFFLDVVALFLQSIWVNKKTIFTFLKKISFIFLCLLFFMHLTNPYLLKYPINGILDMINSSKDYPFNILVLFEGVLRSSRDLPWYYLPKIILITSPLMTVALFFIGLMRLIRLIRPMSLISVNKKILYLYLIALFSVPILLVILFKPLIYDSWRQYLFLTIPLVVIATFGLSWLLEIRSGFIKVIIVIIIITGLGLTGREMVRLHPYQYIYYNSLVGGLKGAYGKYEIDYWGAGFKEAVLWFNKHIYKDGKSYAIATDGNRYSLIPYFKKNTSITFNPVAANYMFTFTRWGFFLKLPGKIIYTLEREGVPIIFIKEVNPVR